VSAAASFRSSFGARLRARRAALVLEGARLGGRRALVLSLVLLGLAVLGVLPPPSGVAAAVAGFVAVLLGGAGLGAALLLRARGGAGPFAAEVDRLLGGADLVATAVAVAARPGTRGRFGEAVVEAAAEAVAALPRERLGPLPRPPWRLLGLAALVAILLALLPQGGFGILPGLGSGWGTGGRPRAGSVSWGEPGPADGGEPRTRPEAGEPGTEESERLPPTAERPPEPPPTPVASIEARPLERVHRAGDPIPVAAMVEGLAGAGTGTGLDLAFSVDGGEAAGEGRARRVAAGDRLPRLVDLREDFPPLRAALRPGTRRVVASLLDPAGRTVARAPEFEVRIEGDGDDGGGGGDPPPAPAPAVPAPAAPPPAVPPPGPGPADAAPEVPLPPSRLERRLVLPLFGEGPERVKRGPILVLDPDAGRGAPPREMDPREAVAEVRARAEEAARREGADPRDLETIRRYFEALRRIVEGGR